VIVNGPPAAGVFTFTRKRPSAPAFVVATSFVQLGATVIFLLAFALFYSATLFCCCSTMCDPITNGRRTSARAAAVNAAVMKSATPIDSGARSDAKAVGRDIPGSRIGERGREGRP